MATQGDTDILTAVYRKRVGPVTTDDEVSGYWWIVIGTVISTVGILLFLYSATLSVSGPRSAQPESYWTVREVAYVMASLGVPVVLIGVVVRLPLRKRATYVGYLGGLVCLVAILWFTTVFPDAWPRRGGDPQVIGLYTVGIFVIGLAATLIPLISPTAEEPEPEPVEDASDAEVTALEAELAALRESQARFEVYEDRAGEHRWRLRHRNGNVIADSGEGYSSRQKCHQGLHSVKRNALGAGILRIEKDEPDDADEPAVAVAAVADEVESQSTFEIYEDAGTDWRWRLRHQNGNVIADSGQGYASRRGVREAVDRVREHVVAADYLRVDPAAFELYRDKGGQWRWRLLHENGNVLADSGQGYSSRFAARKGSESVRNNIGDADIEEQ